jgi:hypothetical protein
MEPFVISFNMLRFWVVLGFAGRGTLTGAPMPGEGGADPPGFPPIALPPPPADATGPSIFTALKEQLGLELKSTKAPAEIVVIDHVERPSEN